MPVVTVTAPPPADAVLLRAVADAIAGALDLGPGDVIAILVRADAVALSGGEDADAWPVVAIHGAGRGADRTARTRAAAERAVAEWAASAGLALGGVWTEWVPPDPGSAA